MFIQLLFEIWEIKKNGRIWDIFSDRLITLNQLNAMHHLQIRWNESQIKLESHYKVKPASTWIEGKSCWLTNTSAQQPHMRVSCLDCARYNADTKYSTVFSLCGTGNGLFFDAGFYFLNTWQCYVLWCCFFFLFDCKLDKMFTGFLFSRFNDCCAIIRKYFVFA